MTTYALGVILLLGLSTIGGIATAQDRVKHCDSVDDFAEAYLPPAIIVTVTKRTSEPKYCKFSINGAVPPENQEAKPHAAHALESWKKIRYSEENNSLMANGTIISEETLAANIIGPLLTAGLSSEEQEMRQSLTGIVSENFKELGFCTEEFLLEREFDPIRYDKFRCFLDDSFGKDLVVEAESDELFVQLTLFHPGSV